MKGSKYLLTLTIVCLILLLSCDGATRFTGKVVSSKNKSLENAEVELSIIDGDGALYRTCKTMTDVEGKFDLWTGTHAPGRHLVLIKIAKEGYKPYATVIKTSGLLNGQFVLYEYSEDKESIGTFNKK